MDRLARKFETARTLVPAAEIDEVPGSQLAIVAYGSTRYAIDEARDQLAAQGITTSFMRLRALPIGSEVRDFISRHENLVLIEMNRDGHSPASCVTSCPSTPAYDP